MPYPVQRHPVDYQLGIVVKEAFESMSVVCVDNVCAFIEFLAMGVEPVEYLLKAHILGLLEDAAEILVAHNLILYLSSCRLTDFGIVLRNEHFILKILKDSYKSYDRMKILRRDRVESVINILLSQAHKLTAEELLAYKGKFTDFKPDTSHAPAKADATKQDGTPFPAELQNAIPYLDVLKKHGLLDDNYRWTHKNNITNYHAAWASKIIIHNCPGATHNLIGQLIGINAPGTYVSLANAKESVKRLIEKLFSDEGLNVTMN